VPVALALLSFALAGDGLITPAELVPNTQGRGDHNHLGPLDRGHLAVVINADDPLSEAIGRLYARGRRIPADQVLRVRLPVGQADLAPARFRRLEAELRRRTPAHVQAYALAWQEPWRVGCQSITAAVTLGLDAGACQRTCRATRLSPYHARGDVLRPWDQLRLRPSMLLAARNIDQARGLISRGIAADGTAPSGTAYLLSTSDSARNVRAAGYGAVAAAAGPGFRVRILHGDALRGADDVMAYFTGLAVVPEIASNRYRPGAVADHLTSLGGQLSIETGQMSALRWLEAGATGSYGTVVEPCNFRAKFSNPGLLLAYYRRGNTLLEAYWRSVAMPDQGVFIGEPLARPWPARSGVSSGGASDARPRRAQ
jgi:uncharacterized protein (TIGR03790 family)